MPENGCGRISAISLSIRPRIVDHSCASARGTQAPDVGFGTRQVGRLAVRAHELAQRVLGQHGHVLLGFSGDLAQFPEEGRAYAEV